MRNTRKIILFFLTLGLTASQSFAMGKKPHTTGAHTAKANFAPLSDSGLEQLKKISASNWKQYYAPGPGPCSKGSTQYKDLAPAKFYELCPNGLELEPLHLLQELNVSATNRYLRVSSHSVFNSEENSIRHDTDGDAASVKQVVERLAAGERGEILYVLDIKAGPSKEAIDNRMSFVAVNPKAFIPNGTSSQILRAVNEEKKIVLFQCEAIGFVLNEAADSLLVNCYSSLNDEKPSTLSYTKQ